MYEEEPFESGQPVNIICKLERKVKTAKNPLINQGKLIRIADTSL